MYNPYLTINISILTYISVSSRKINKKIKFFQNFFRGLFYWPAGVETVQIYFFFYEAFFAGSAHQRLNVVIPE